MLRNFIPGKLAHFAILMLLVFLLAQSGAARAQGDDQQLFSGIIEDARNSGGWSDCRYADGNLLECHTENFSVFPVSASKSLIEPLKQSGITLTAVGQDCDTETFDEFESCFDIKFDFDPAGGPVSGSYSSSGYYNFNANDRYYTQTWSRQFMLEGFLYINEFTEHIIEGTYNGQSIDSDDGETISRTLNGTWHGYLYGDGTGWGSLDSDSFSSEAWSVTFDAEAFQNALTESPTNPIPPDPDPYIDPDPYFDPNPNPDPGPIRIDPETLSILQSILSTPALPITGAVAGGLVAWVLSMLGGGRPVLPSAPRPPTGGLRPGQVGPNGKILSPTGQGWVSKSIYDYQQKWLQKGWRWNSQTGKFEGQHGAVNEKGLVQDDELGWVDQKTFNDNEQMRAQGYVYDRSMGWQTPEDSNRFKSDRDGMRQRERERSADKNAQIQSELKESQAQRDQAFQQQMQKLDAGRIAEIKANMEMYQKRAQKYVNWDKNLEYATYVAQTVETAADVGVAVCARLTGPAGKAIAAAYETAKEVATTADDVIASDDVVGKAEELGDDKIKDEYKDKIKEKIEEKVTPYIPKFVNRIANQIKRPIKKFILRKTGKTGLIIYQEAEKKLLEYGKEQVEEFVEGQVETAVEEIKNNIDPNLLTGV